MKIIKVENGARAAHVTMSLLVIGEEVKLPGVEHEIAIAQVNIPKVMSVGRLTKNSYDSRIGVRMLRRCKRGFRSCKSKGWKKHA